MAPPRKRLADDLESFLKGESIQARPRNRLAKLWRWCRRRTALMTGVAVLVITVLILGAVALWSEERQRAATELAVAEDLKEAETWQRMDQWPKALQALERAAGRLPGSGSSNLQAQVESCGDRSWPWSINWRKAASESVCHGFS